MSVSHNSILETVKSLKILLSKEEQNKGKKFLLYTALVGLADVLALVTVVPILMLAIDGDFLAKSSKLRKIYSILNMPNESTFLITLIVGVVIFFIFKNTLAIFIQNKLQSFCIDIVQKFTIKSFNGVISNSFIETLQKGSSDLFQKVHFNSYLYVAGIVLPFVNFIGESVVLIVVLIFIITFNPTVFILIALFTAPAFYIINRSIKNKIYNLGLKTKGIREETIDSLNIGINGIADIKLNQSSKYFIDQFIQKQKFLLECDFKSYYFQQIPSRANEIVVLLGVIVLVVYGYFFSDNPGNLRVIGALFVLSVFRLVPALNRLLVALMKLKLYQYTAEFLTQKRENESVNHHKIHFENSIKIQNVVFYHSEKHEPTIDDVSFEINKNSIVAIVGENGSGKSSLFRLISGIYSPNSGEISIDGVKLDDSNKLDWQRKIGFVHQNPFIFNTSIVQNITFDEQYNQENLEEAIINSGLSDFVQSLEKGINTIIGEQGSKISEGQKQRIAIARALYKKSEILLLDEATSALDTKNEDLIINTLLNLKKIGYTILIIAHKNKVTEIAEKIYELKEGKIINERK